MMRASSYLTFVLVWLLSAAAHAAPAPDAGVAMDEEPVAADSPRAAMQTYFSLVRKGSYAQAAQSLELSAKQAPRGAELAKRLQAVLNRYAWIDLDDLSGRSEGDIEDGLSRRSEDIAKIPSANEGLAPVRLTRVTTKAGAKWVFSRSTVGRIDAWYAQLGNRWFLERAPAALLRPGPKELLWGQWLALPLLVVVAWLFAFVIGRTTRFLWSPMLRRTPTRWDDLILDRTAGPLRMGIAAGLVYLALPWLGLYDPAQRFIERGLRAVFVASFFWALFRCVDVSIRVVAQSPWATTRAAALSILPLGARLGKVVIVVLATIALFSALGFPVGSLLAGLGIGGLAVALAAQKTLENLLGAVSIAVDQPFREGDFVKVEGVQGNVEIIGLRATRIRTADRTLVSIPNGKLADMRLETFAARDRILFNCKLGLAYDTTASQMRSILTGMERALRDHPEVWQETVIVRFVALATSSLDIEVTAWFQTLDGVEFLRLREDMLLRFMEVVEAAGASFALPPMNPTIKNPGAPSV